MKKHLTFGQMKALLELVERCEQKGDLLTRAAEKLRENVKWVELHRTRRQLRDKEPRI